MYIPLLSFAIIWATYFIQTAPIVDLGYAKYRGSMNKVTGNIEFLGVRYAAAPTGILLPSLLWLSMCLAFIRAVSLEGASITWSYSRYSDRGHSALHLLAGWTRQARFSAAIRRLSFSQVCSENTAHVIPLIDDLLVLSHLPLARKTCLLLFGFMGSYPSNSLFEWQYRELRRGGYFTGSAFMYNGNDLMLQAGGEVIVVVIQYRLGVFGFLSGQKIHDRGTLNAGLCKYNTPPERDRTLSSNEDDQQFALQWIQRHVSALWFPSFRTCGNLCIIRSVSLEEIPTRWQFGESLRVRITDPVIALSNCRHKVPVLLFSMSSQTMETRSLRSFVQP